MEIGLPGTMLGVADADGGELAGVSDVHPPVEAAEGSDDLLDLGIHLGVFALVDRDLLVEVQLRRRAGGPVGCGHGMSMALKSLELKTCTMYSLESNFSLEVFQAQ